MATAIITAADVTISREQLLDNASRVAGGLVELGVAPGDRVALVARNSVEFLEITIAAGIAGAFAVPVNWHFTKAESEALIEDCDPRVIFVQEDFAKSISTDLSEEKAVIGIGSGASSAYVTWRDSRPRYTGERRVSPGSMVYTSGTTGRPKGVRRLPPSPEQEIRMRTIRSELYRIESQSRLLVPGPLYHTFPNQFALHGAMNAEYTNIAARFDAEQLLATIERERITSVALAPIMFVRLLKLPSAVRSRYDLTSLRWAIQAGGPCANDVKRAMIEWWGPVIAEYYGGTETGPLTLATSEEWLKRPGTCGKPFADVELRLVTGSGEEVVRGEPGEVYGRLWAYPDFTYHNDPSKREAVGLGPLVSLGDVGYQDEDGYLYLCDRARDMIVSGGVNIYPAEVESALFGLTGVTDAAVFGIPDQEFGEAVVAFVCGEALEGEGLREKLRGLIAGYKIPRLIVPTNSIDRDPSGKVRKQDLRQRFLDDRARAPS